MSSRWVQRHVRGKHPTEDVIYERLVDAIIEKRLRAGEHLNEAKLAEAHGVPRSRVRRVLERLRDENVVTFELHRGAFISRPTVEEAFHVYEARREIELTVVRLACARATADDVAALKAHLEREATAFSNEDANVNKVSGEFHTLLGAMGRNPVFEKLLGSLIHQWVLIQSVYERKGGAICLTHEHVRIAAAVAENRPDDAVAELAGHFDHILAALDLTEDRRAESDIYDVAEVAQG